MLKQLEIVKDLKTRKHQIDLLKDVAVNILSFKDYMTFFKWYSETDDKILLELSQYNNDMESQND
jgi:hypothetical protein